MELESRRKKHWHYLDLTYYLKECALAGVSVPSVDPPKILSHYNEFAGKFKLSPNPFFDERYYREVYPAVNADIERGKFHSGFHHFDLIGARTGLSPNWFFSGAWYVARYSELTEQELRFKGFADAYSHYLAFGIGEGYGGMWLTAAVTEAKLSDAIPTCFADLLESLTRPGGRAKWLGPLFDAAWWAAKYNQSNLDDCVIQYLRGIKEAPLSPSSTFDEAFYLHHYPDVASNIEQRHFDCGFHHFLQFGMNEGRQPLAIFDTDYYLTENLGVAKECIGERIAPYIHFLKYRKTRSLKIESAFASRPCSEGAGKTIFERKAKVLAELGTLYIKESVKPVLSIILIARNMYAETIQCLETIVRTTKCDYELILFDNASEDEVAEIPRRFPAIRYVRSDTNLGFTIPVNRAAALARGAVLLLVNNDIEVAPGAVDRALNRLQSDRTIGIIGGRIIRTHGILQEAGSIVWRDGTCLGYGRDLSPHHGAVLFERDVDFCSGCFLAIRTDDWKALDGFDETYAPAYYEETDLCLRMWETGKRVVYDPAIVVWHFEYGSSKLHEDALALMRRNQMYFQNKFKSYLKFCFAPAESKVEVARLRYTKTPRLLFIEDYIPQASTGQGFVRSSHVARILQRHMGFTTVVGMNPSPTEPSLDATRPNIGAVELRDDVSHETLHSFLDRIDNFYDFIWLSRTHNIRHLMSYLDSRPSVRKPHIIIDTEAIASLRTRHHANLLGVDLEIDELLSRELDGIEKADHICVVNEMDRAAVMRYLSLKRYERPISVLGHALQAVAEMPDFQETSTILLAGSFATFEGPNADGLRWFDTYVRPRLNELLPSAEYVIAGFRADKFCSHAGLVSRYTVLSDVPDMGRIYRNARVAIAPTRFAGGIPFKVHEAASFGVPTAMTDLLAKQLGWSGDASLAIGTPDDPEGFARMTAELYSDRRAWSDCRKRQLERIGTECDPNEFERRVVEIVHDRRGTPPAILAQPISEGAAYMR